MPVRSSTRRNKPKKKKRASEPTSEFSKDQATTSEKNASTESSCIDSLLVGRHDKATKLKQLSTAIECSTFGNCSTYSEIECVGIAEAILESEDDILAASSDFLDISIQEAQILFKTVFSKKTDDLDCCGSAASSCSGADDNLEYDEKSIASANSADVYIEEGECELCEREVKLTKHHLIPKSTWKHIKQRFMKAAKPYKELHFEEVKETLGLGNELLEGVSRRTFTSGISIKLFLGNYTANLCRACHSCIHSNYDNMELAERFNSVEKLLEDEQIYKFCKWQSKQKRRNK